MAKGRSKRPLFEVLSTPDRRPGPTAPGAVRPIEVRVPAATPPQSQAPSRDSSDPAPDRNLRTIRDGLRLPVWSIYLAIAGLLTLVAIVWVVAWRMGVQEEQSRLATKREELFQDGPPGGGPIPGATNPGPANPGPTGTSSSVRDPVVAPQSPLPTQTATGPQTTPDQNTTTSPTPPQGPTANFSDPRKDGVNYLHVVTLTWKDAERAVAFLTQNGVSAAAVPSRRVDPAEARAKNLPHLVFVQEGIPSEQFKASERRRNELVERVRRIGKRWQSEERGPSDFGEPGWVRFKAERSSP